MRRVIVDSDTASDDAIALLLASLSERVRLDAVTVVAGNVAFDRQVENAKYTLSLADRTDVPVIEGARQPLVKEFEDATAVHGDGGLGGDLHPETGVPTAAGFAPDEIVTRCRDAPGDVTLLCLGPLTNVALALAREPALPDMVESVWVMGGAVHWQGNVTPAAEFNFWVDPDAAHRVLESFEVTLVDWGVCSRDGTLDAATFAAIDAADTDLARFVSTATSAARESDTPRAGELVVADALTTAALAYPELVERRSDVAVTVDEREGLTRGYTSVDASPSAAAANATLVTQADADSFRSVVVATVRERAPDATFD